MTLLQFAHPGHLALLIVPLLLAAWRWRARGNPEPAIPLPTVDRLAGFSPGWRVRLRWLPDALLIVSALALVVALAQPQEGLRRSFIESEGIAIELVVDRSSSMRAMDFELDGRPVDRLTAVKRVAATFLRGDDAADGLPGRPADLVGLVIFAGYADVESPLTLDHAYVIDGLAEAEIADTRHEDGTALGDALGLAVERLAGLDTEVASRVVILLTDGEQTAGSLTPDQAAELAASVGVRVYTIGVGTRGMAPVPVQDFFGRSRVRRMPVNIDEDTLRAIAETTGGQYFRATDTDSLIGVYAAIDALEKTRLEERAVVDTRELAVESFGGIPPVLSLAALPLAAAGVLRYFVLGGIT